MNFSEESIEKEPDMNWRMPLDFPERLERNREYSTSKLLYNRGSIILYKTHVSYGVVPWLCSVIEN